MSVADTIRGVNDKTREFLRHRQMRRDAERSQLRFEAETKQFLRTLPKRNLQLTHSNHKLFIEIVKGLQALAWNDHELHEWAEKILKEEQERYEQDVSECHKRLGWKPPESSSTSKHIRWTG